MIDHFQNNLKLPWLNGFKHTHSNDLYFVMHVVAAAVGDTSKFEELVIQCLNIQRWSEVCQVCSACVPNGPLITSLKTNVNSNHHIVLEEAIGRSQKNSKQYCIILIAIPFPATVVPPPNEPSFFFQKNRQNFFSPCVQCVFSFHLLYAFVRLFFCLFFIR